MHNVVSHCQNNGMNSVGDQCENVSALSRENGALATARGMLIVFYVI